MKILVVDDEQLLVKGIKFNLENEGYQVLTAYDGAAAVELARREPLDLIILDLMMPQLSGSEACMKIREFPMCPSSCSPPAARMRTSSWASPAAPMTMSPSPSTSWS